MMCLRCKHDRRHAARGLCEPCYKHLYDHEELDQYPRLYRLGISKRCAYWREYKRRKRAEARAA
jgi:hypothetical protein